MSECLEETTNYSGSNATSYVLMTTLTLNLGSVISLTHEAFYALCQANPDIQFERTARGLINFT